MKKLINIMLAALIALALPCTANGVNTEQQQRKTTAAKKTTTQRKKTTTARKHATAAKKKTTQRKKTATKKKRSAKQNNAKYSTAEIRGLQSKRSGIQKEIKKQEAALRANKADVKKRLNDLLILNSEIDRHKQNIDGIQRDITHLDGNIGLLNAQLATLQQQLKERKAKYVKSMRYISRQHTMQDRLMFIFSAKSLTEMYRRLRFVREYSSWQKAQGEMVKSKQLQVNEKHKQLQQVRGQKNVMLNKGRQEHRALESKQSEQQTMVNSLQKQQKTIQSVIAKQRKDASALNAQIDRLVAIEVEKARKRAGGGGPGPGLPKPPLRRSVARQNWLVSVPRQKKHAPRTNADCAKLARLRNAPSCVLAKPQHSRRHAPSSRLARQRLSARL